MQDAPAKKVLELSVRWSETGPGGWLKPASWLDFCMEAADANAREIGVSMHDVSPMGYYWVMSRYRLAFDATPRARDRLRITTWPRGFHRLFALREFLFSTPEGDSLGRGTTGWLLVKKENFRPVRPGEHLPDFPKSPDIGYTESIDALAAWDPAGEPSLELAVRREEIDLVGHVSNPHYIRWALEAIPAAVFDTHRLTRLDVDFLGMAFAGDPIAVWTEALPGELPTYRQVVRPHDSTRDLTRIFTQWEPRRD